jgi:hypothetical protein
VVYAYNMARRKKKEHDFAITAFRVVQEATGQIEEEPKPDIDYSALGHKGGLKGGKARAERLTPDKRKEIARKAAQARWARGS